MKGLRAVREQLGISLIELEKMTGIDASSLSRYERGKVVPSAEMAQKIANSLNISVDNLLNGPVKQEFEVKILMGVKSLANVAGLEIKDDSFFYGVDDEKPEIHIGGKVNIATTEYREKALKKITESFLRACWMFDHRDEAGLAIQTA